ncbi:MAG: PEGA domain-containing protein [Caldisericia bacterium]
MPGCDHQCKRDSAPRTYKFIELKKLHKIYLDYKPRGSKVYDYDESFLGTTPCEVEMTRGEKTVSVKFPYHEDYIDSFVVTGSGMRTEELIPTIKYFPETYCNITTTPDGASVKSLVACGEKLLGEFDDWGQTPIRGTNSDVMEAKCDRVFFITHESKYPAVLRFRGSINTDLELVNKGNIKIPELPDKTPANLEFKRGMFEDGSQPFNAVFEGNFFKIISTKYFVPVEIIDLRTDKSDISGANWFDERFFVVRFKNDEGDTKYLIYDSMERRRVSFDNFGLYHERNIPGIIRWKEQIPTSPTRVNEFFDIRYSVNNDGMFFFLKLYSGAGCWLVVKTDFEINSSQLVDILLQ